MTCILGLSGGIGSGKSTVTQMLAELGAITIDADAIVHEQQAIGQPVLNEIVKAFGKDVLAADGSLDREALGAIVFRDEKARTQLGRITHPPVIAEMARRTKEAVLAGAPLVVLDIPLLFEGRVKGRGSSSAIDFDATLCVWASREIQIERTRMRDDSDVEEAIRRVMSQLPIDEKRDLADHVIDNSGSVEETRAQVVKLIRHLTNGQLSGEAASSGPR